MDYLTWLMALQETDSQEHLPEFFGEMAVFGQAASADVSAAFTVAAKELEAQWERTALAAEQLQRRFVHQETAASQEAGTGTARTVPYVAFSQESRYGEGFREVGGGADMEAISRFFERDARRF